MNAQSKGAARPTSRWLRLARIAAWIFVLAVIVLFLSAAIQFYASGLAVLSTILPNSNWTVERLRAALIDIGWTPQAYILHYFASTLFSAFWFAIVALLILWRRGDTWFGLLLAVELAAIGVAANSVFDIAQVSQPISRALGWILWPGFFICFYLFPDGHFVPRWTRWLTVMWGVVSLLGYLTTTPRQSQIPPCFFIPLVIGILAAPASQIFRYLRVSNPLQKQQTKVVFGAMVVFFVILITSLFVNQFYGNSEISLGALQWNLVNELISTIISSLLPISIGVAMLRYHLWDVDIIIRKTLIYSVLTALLALIYFGGVVLVQQLTRSITASSDLAIVVSTLVIAALFFPLRRRVQNAIDRRFYRRKYDAAKTLAAFSATVRDEVELEKLTAELIKVVNETMQPASVSLWLKPTAEKQKRTIG